jgi:hypothetical protein
MAEMSTGGRIEHHRDATDAAGPRHRLTVFGILLAMTLSAIIVVSLAWTDHDRVESHAAQASVDLGRPLDWMHQYQRAIDAQTPTSMGANSPWETPTTSSVVPFLADWLLVLGSLAVVWAVLSAVALVRSAIARPSARM